MLFTMHHPTVPQAMRHARASLKMLVRALGIGCRDYFRTVNRGYNHANHQFDRTRK